MITKFFNHNKRYFGVYAIFFCITTVFTIVINLLTYYYCNNPSSIHLKLFEEWVYHLFFTVIIYSVFLGIFIPDIKSKYYKFVTGGNALSKDQSAAKKTLPQLVKFADKSDPHRINPYTLPKGIWRDYSGIHFGKIDDRVISYIPKRDGIVSILTGNPGTGKTVTILSSALSFPGGVFGIEYKVGDMTDVIRKYSNRNVKIFSPENLNNSCCFDPLRCFWDKSLDGQREYIEKLASIIIPGATGSDKYWVDTPRDFFCGLTFLYIYEDSSLTFPAIIKKILSSNFADAVNNVLASDCAVAKSYVANYFGNNERNVSSGFNELIKNLRNLSTDNLCDLLVGSYDESAEIVPEDLQNGCDIYIQVSQKNKNFYAPVINIITTSFLDYFLSIPEEKDGTNPPILFILDEAGAVLNLPYEFISEVCASARSKNLSLLFGLQSLEQWNNRYGNSGCAALIGTARYIATCTISDLFTRKFYSELIGTHIVHSKSITYNTSGHKTSETITETREPVFQPEDFGDLNDDSKDRHEIVIYADGKYIRANQIRYFEDI